MSHIEVRNSALREIAKAISLTADIAISPVLDFRDSKCGTIQIIRLGGDVNDGIFSLKVSLLCDPSTFFPFPDSEIAGCTDANLGWIFERIPFRFAQVNYAKGTDTVGTFSIFATGKK